MSSEITEEFWARSKTGQRYRVLKIQKRIGPGVLGLPDYKTADGEELNVVDDQHTLFETVFTRLRLMREP